MNAALEQIAASIKQHVDHCSVVRVWGGNIFPPGDRTYEVLGASVNGEALHVHLALALDDSRRDLEIVSPAGVKIDRGSLRIQSAASVRWNGEECERPATLAGAALFVGD